MEIENKLDMFLESIDREYKEAVLGKQLSKSGKDEYEKSREGYKDLTHRIASEKDLNKVLKPDFHLLSPMKKQKIINSLGFGDGTKREDVNGITYINNSPIHPDILFTLCDVLGCSNESDIVSEGSTFIYYVSTGHVIKSITALETHGQLKKSSDRDSENEIHGRWIKLLEKVDVNAIILDLGKYAPKFKLAKGIHMTFWEPVSPETSEKIVKALQIPAPKVIHNPDSVAVTAWG